MCSASRTSDFDTFDEERHDTAGNVPHKQLCIQIHNAKCTTACGSTDLNSHCTVTRTHATPFNTPKSCSVRRSDQCSSDETPWTRRHALRETEVEITPKVGRVMSAQPPTHTHSKAVTCASKRRVPRTVLVIPHRPLIPPATFPWTRPLDATQSSARKRMSKFKLRVAARLRGHSCPLDDLCVPVSPTRRLYKTIPLG